MSGQRGEGYSEAFVRIADLALACGVRDLSFKPVWEHQVDERWWIAFNGAPEPRPCSRGNVPIPRFSAYVMFNGWPAGVLNPFGGTLAAGEAANEDTLIAALDAAIERQEATE